MINKEEMIKILCKSYPGFRDRMVSRASDWMSEDGSILYIILIGSLSALVLERFTEGNYDNSDELFASVEALLENGDGQVREIIATGFLESMQNQTELPGKYWAPLLGRHATEFCRGMDEFHGVKTEGLRCYNV
ncbi:DUF7674 family protein [Rheinheimera sp. NSM]|uniref:DUF7674 family protein n=1 Tax=Rheinheimera sp. NSM TaxID=3457884 RepID=UPI0040367177